MKKTRKQKILAELHRLKVKSQPDPNPTTHLSADATHHASQTGYSLPVSYSQPSTVDVLTVNPKLDYSYMTQGLKQTSALTILAICAQLVLWYLKGR